MSICITKAAEAHWRNASTRQPNGMTDIGAAAVRDGKNVKGRVLSLVLRTIGRRVLEKSFENSVKTIEARNSTAGERAAGTP